jgi:hypothetical protein
METKTDVRNVTERSVQVIDFGLVDQKGRKIGMEIYTWEQDFVEVPQDSTSWYRIPVGHYFIVRGSATRDGQVFGAYQYPIEFKTIEERDAYIEKRIASTKKRYEKTFKKVA